MEAHAWDWSRILEATAKADAAAGTSESRHTVFIKEVPALPPIKHAHPRASLPPMLLGRNLLWPDSTGRTFRRRMHLVSARSASAMAIGCANAQRLQWCDRSEAGLPCADDALLLQRTRLQPTSRLRSTVGVLTAYL